MKLEYEISLCNPFGSVVTAERENGGGGGRGGAGGGVNRGGEMRLSSSDTDIVTYKQEGSIINIIDYIYFTGKKSSYEI